MKLESIHKKCVHTSWLRPITLATPIYLLRPRINHMTPDVLHRAFTTVVGQEVGEDPPNAVHPEGEHYFVEQVSVRILADLDTVAAIDLRRGQRSNVIQLGVYNRLRGSN